MARKVILYNRNHYFKLKKCRLPSQSVADLGPKKFDQKCYAGLKKWMWMLSTSK